MATHTAGHCRGADDPDPARPHPRDGRGPDATPPSDPPLQPGPPSPGPPLPPGPPRPALPPTAAGRPPQPWPYAVHLTGGGSPRREPRSVFVPVLCSVLCAPLLLFGALLFMFSPFATDPCSPDGCHALFRAMEVDPCVLALSVLLLAGCWAVPDRRPAVRLLLGVGALAAALTGVYLYVHLPAAS